MEERLQKYLARAGVASRRKAEELILEGRVTVNGVVVRKMGVKVVAGTDEVRLDTVLVKAGPALALPKRGLRGVPGADAPPVPRPPADGVYLLLHKPTGVLTTVTDDHGRTTVMDILPPQRKRVFPVGRLDEDSEGLLLLTSDGNLAQLLTHPRYEVPKVYDLRIRGEISADAVRTVERGVWLSEGKTGPARMHIRRAGRDISHVQMTLREGKNREVRRIFARLRHPVLSLRRISLGPLELGALKPGQCRRLSPAEVKALYAAALGTGATMPERAERPERSKPGRGGPPRREGSGRDGSGRDGSRRPGKPSRFDGRVKSPRPGGPGKPPRSGYAGKHPRPGASGKPPHSGYAGKHPRPGASGKPPHSGYAGKHPRPGASGKPPRSGYAGKHPRPGSPGGPSRSGNGGKDSRPGSPGKPFRPGGGSGHSRPSKGGPRRPPRPGGRR